MQLHEYQKRMANFIALHPAAVLSVDMGLGKTAATLAWMDWHEKRYNYSLRGVIIAPKRVAENNWLQEAQKWGLAQLADSMVIVAGTPKKRALAMADDVHPIKVISRDLITKYEWPRLDFMVIDELTTFKSTNAKRTKAVLKIQARQRVGLTGTFLANGAIDIYAQCAAVGLRYPHAKNFYGWRAQYFRDLMAGSGQPFHKWQLVCDMPTLLAPVSNSIFTLTAADYLQIPPVTETAHPIDVGREIRDQIADLDAFLSMQIGDQIFTIDEGAKFAKLQTLCNGFVYDAEGNTLRNKCSAKLEAVADFVADCKDAGEPVLLFYAFRAEAIWLVELLRERGVGCDSVKNAGFLERWNDRQTDCLLAHPASAGHGLNLQHGGRVIVWSTVTYNYEYFAQANARLARQGQRQNVQIHYFTAAGTCEGRIWKALREKDKQQKQFLKLTKQ